jgi:hypothetical protein
MDRTGCCKHMAYTQFPDSVETQGRTVILNRVPHVKQAVFWFFHILMIL